MNPLADLRVMLVDDHNLFLEGLTNLLASEGIPVVGTAHDGFKALTLARQLKPDVILMDIHMPRCDGVSATRLIKAEMPEIKIVMLTTSEDEADLFEAVRGGALGYLLKSLEADAFFAYLRDLQSGHAPFSPGLAEKILKAFAEQPTRPVGQGLPEGPEAGDARCAQQLTPRQMQILTLVGQGQTYREVAVTLSITERTVKYHMGEILDCLHLENRAQVIAYAERMRLTRPGE
ncbi:MAG: response regulator transcription factor [Brevefilum sp.]|nr:response regulator transcription factor [Brevefilum sp.]